MIAKKITTSIILFLSLIFINCDKYEFPNSPYPNVETLPAINISKTGATLQGNIERLGEEPILNHGFVWGLSLSLSPLLNSDKVLLGKKSGVGFFSKEVNSGFFKDTTYYFQAFVQTKKYTVYGPVTSFRSLGSKAPIIKSVSPIQGTWGDTVIISGNYFSSLSVKNNLKFGIYPAYIINCNDSVISCRVPDNDGATSAPISLKVSEYELTFKDNFEYTSPIIDGFTPAQGKPGDLITVTGKNFSSSNDLNIVKFFDRLSEVVHSSRTSLIVRVPESITVKQSKIVVTVSLQTASSKTYFTCTPCN
jgi:hypothetical protein